MVRNIIVMTVAALVAVVGWGGLGQASAPKNADLPKVIVESAWSRPAIAGGHGAVYFTITNEGETAVTLIGGETDVSESVEIHQTVLLTGDEEHDMHHDHNGHDHHDHHAHHGHDHGHHDHGDHDGGTFVMLHLENLELAPKEQMVFGPAGHHIMLINLTKTLAWDETFPLTLYFEEISPITVLVTVGNDPGA